MHRDRHQSRASVAVLAALAALGAGPVGCADDADEGIAIPQPDPVEFQDVAYPILLGDCGFPACHGDARRFFAIFGPGRTRLSSASGPYDPATPDELALSYTRASSMLVDPGGVRSSPLLRTALAVSAGGAAHSGDDPWGAPVYASTADPDWTALVLWARTAETGTP